MQNNISFNIELLIEEYTPYIYKVIDNAVGTNLTPEDKEEVISDAFYLLWKNGSKIETNLKSYLAKIAKNCAYHKLKNKHYNYELQDDIFDYNIQSSLDNNLIIKEKISILNKEEKIILNLYYVDGYKTKEIAKMLNKSNGNIKVILHRIRKKMKEDK